MLHEVPSCSAFLWQGSIKAEYKIFVSTINVRLVMLGKSLQLFKAGNGNASVVGFQHIRAEISK